MKIIFITGGVVSSLGKGIIASSLGRLLEDGGINVGMMKCDPYLNVDAGLMSPIEHGEVFVTSDGGETDLDIGHYERFLNKDLGKDSSLTSGKIYLEIISNERAGLYNGKTVQVIPHVTDLIKKKIFEVSKKYDLLIVEVGGSVGDIESLAYIEAIRQIKYELGENTAIVHVGYVPFIKVNGELKTKPIQRSINLLRSFGVVPNFLITRSEVVLTEKELDKISMFGDVKLSRIFQSVDIDSIYKIPLELKRQGFDKSISEYMNLNIKESLHKDLNDFNKKIKSLEKQVNIAIIGKYTKNPDSYISIIEALKNASINEKIKVNIELIDSKSEYDVDILKKIDGILIPGGFGLDGVEGKLRGIKFARENNIPFLGICFGMQLAILEFAINVLKIDVEHGELNPEAKNKIIHKIENVIFNDDNMRLGNYNCEIKNNTLAKNIYQENNIVERHRHKYEFNNKYLDVLEENGMIISGFHLETGLAEIIENKNNKFFIATQFHPEFSSKITKPNKLFTAFIKESLSLKK